MRIIGIDYGDKNIGVAVSDAFNKIAFGVTTIRRTDPNAFKKIISELKIIIDKYESKKIVLGFPKNMNNTEGERCEKTILFKERLNRNFKKVEVVLWDERLSTMESKRVLEEALLNKNKIKEVIDKMAALHILQSYLDFINNNEV